MCSIAGFVGSIASDWLADANQLYLCGPDDVVFGSRLVGLAHAFHS